MNNSARSTNAETFDRLIPIYKKYSGYRKVDKNSQMCEFWADPTIEILVGSDELFTIETEFGIEFDDDAAMELYNMSLGEAAVFIEKMIEEQHAVNHNPEEFINSIDSDMAKKVLLQLWKNHHEMRSVIVQEIEII